jgi:ABC-type transport system substrate-binding protein
MPGVVPVVWLKEGEMPRSTWSIIAVLLLALVVACGAAATPTPVAQTPGVPAGVATTPVATSAPAPTPILSGKPVVDRLKTALVVERESNDPHLLTLVFAPQFNPMYEALERFDETGKTVPMLATSWEMSSDLKVWTFHLRKGVQWHKGFGEFSARDVVHSIERHVRPESLSTEAAFWRDNIRGNLEVLDNHKIVFRLPQARLDVLELSRNDRYSQILSKAHFDAEGQAGVETNPVGTGPYQQVERRQGAYVLYQRVPYQHYRVTPDFPELQIFFVKEHATRLAMLLAGEVHIAALPADLEATAVDRGMKVIPARTGTVPVYTMFGGNFHPSPAGTRKGEHRDLPYSDVFHPIEEVPWVHQKVREALNRAVNRTEIQATILGGRASQCRWPSIILHCPAGIQSG